MNNKVSSINLVLDDYKKAFKNFNYWKFNAEVETKIKYRRSFLGPFWYTISVLVIILGISFLSKHILTESKFGLPYLISGIVFWFYIKNTIEDSCLLFEILSPQIRNESIPISSYIFYNYYKNLIIFLHNIILLFPLFFMGININLLILLFGFIILSIIVFFVSNIVAILCGKFRDIVPIVQNLITILFFITPIWWQPKEIGLLIKINPVYYLINLVREPLILGTLSLKVLLVSLSILIFVIILNFFVFSRTIKRITLW